MQHHGCMKTRNPQSTPKQVPFSQVQEDALATVTTLPMFEGFYAGAHTDRHGRTYEFTREDLQQMVDNFTPGTVPFLIRHPNAGQGETPAYGYAKNIELTDDNKLLLDGERVNVEFAKSVVTGSYGRRSLGFEADRTQGWKINHVAWLGATAPALDKLAPVGQVQYSANSAPVAFEYSVATQPPEFSLDTQTATALARFMSNVRDWFLSAHGQEAADQVVDRWEVDWLQRQTVREEIKDEDDPLSEFSKPTEPEESMAITKEQLEAATKKAVDDAVAAAKLEFSKELDAANQSKATAEGKAAALEFSQTVKDCQIKVDKAVADGHLTPAAAAGMAEFMAHVKGLESLADVDASQFEFSRGDGDKKETIKTGMFEFCTNLLENIGQKSPLGEAPNVKKDGGTESQDLLSQAREYQKQQADSGVEIDIADAIAHVGGDA